MLRLTHQVVPLKGSFRSRYFLLEAPTHQGTNQGRWFERTAVGHNKLSGMVKEMLRAAGVDD